MAPPDWPLNNRDFGVEAAETGESVARGNVKRDG
jgi:hypothetical protein